MNAHFMMITKKCPLLVGLIISAMVFGMYQGTVSLCNAKVEEKEHKKDDYLVTPKEVETTCEEAKPPKKEKTEEYKTEYLSVTKRIAKSIYYEDFSRIALTSACNYKTATNHYFEDALFIGDSRVVGLSEYGNVKGATFYCKDGISIYKVMEKSIAKTSAGTVTIPEALKQRQFRSIYLMLGVNELGWGYASDYQKAYEKVVKQIQTLQPEATIYIVGTMHIVDGYHGGDDIMNNDNIDMRNSLIAELADGRKIIYLDANETTDDSKGGLNAEYSWDGIHLKAEYYNLWVNYIKEHVVN